MLRVMRPFEVRRGAAVVALLIAAGLAATALAGVGAGVTTGRYRAYDVYALRYATIPNFPVRHLVAGADTSRTIDLAMMFWLVKRPGRNLLVDAGFYRRKFMDAWKPVDYVRPDQVVKRFGLDPEFITDIVVTHVHWDHLDGADLFPNARVWIQAAEYAHHVGENGEALDPAIDPLDAAMLARLRNQGRVELIDGDNRELLPGLYAHTGGKHTFESQYVAVRTTRGKVVLASDNVYLYENLEQHLPIAQTLDATANLAAMERMATTIAVSPSLIVPGHDPAVFERFKKTKKPGVVRIE